jgi:hypothetical protein
MGAVVLVPVVMLLEAVVDFYGVWYIRCRKCRSALPECLKDLQARFWPNVLEFVVVVGIYIYG